MQYKKISILLTTHNANRYIKPQINSILSSIDYYKNYEILISDDASTDQTLRILNDYKKKNKNIKIFKNKFKNINKNINFLIKKSKGDYVFISDHDDIWYKNKIRVCMKYYKNGALLVSHDYKVLRKGQIQNIKNQNANFFKKKNLLTLLYKSSIAGCTMSFNRKCLKHFMPIPKMIIFDWWISTNLYLSLPKSKIIHVKKALIKYRVHNNNQINNIKRSNNSLMRKLYLRINIVTELLKRKFIK